MFRSKNLILKTAFASFRFCTSNPLVLEMEEKLRIKFNPTHLQILDESKNHSRGKNSHFKIAIVSDLFKDLNTRERHQEVYKCLNEEF